MSRRPRASASRRARGPGQRRAAAGAGVGGARLPARRDDGSGCPRTSTTSATAVHLRALAGSTTKADNRVGPADEGLSYVVGEHGERLAPARSGRGAAGPLMGVSTPPPIRPDWAGWRSSSTTRYRLPYHIHPPQEFASLVGANSKDEAYYFLPGVDLGAHPESFFGVHPWIAERGGVRHAAALPRRLGQRPDPAAFPGRAAGARRRLHDPVRGAARPGHGADARAAGGLRRPRDVPGAQRRQDHLARTCCSRTCGRRTAQSTVSGSRSASSSGS